MFLAATAVLLLCAVPASATTIQGRTSWYGGSCDGMDNNITATGIPNTVPGVALFQRWSFRDYWLLTRPRTKRRVVVRHVDYGPAPWTGKTIDVNPPAAEGLGFRAPGGCVQAFPTGERMQLRLLSRRKASRWAKRTTTRVDDRFIWR